MNREPQSDVEEQVPQNDVEQVCVQTEKESKMLELQDTEQPEILEIQVEQPVNQPDKEQGQEQLLEEQIGLELQNNHQQSACPSSGEGMPDMIQQHRLQDEVETSCLDTVEGLEVIWLGNGEQSEETREQHEHTVAKNEKIGIQMFEHQVDSALQDVVQESQRDQNEANSVILKLREKNYTTSDTIRIVLLGKTGTGKSTTGNTILGREHFHSEYSMSSVTRVCKEGSTDRFGTPILVVDTPGLFDTEMTNAQVTKEIVRVVSITAPGPHAFLLTLKPGRFTEEEKNTIKRIRDQFGNDMLKYTVIVFTGVDELKRHKYSLEKYLEEAPAVVRELVKECKGRYIGIDNTAETSEKDMKIGELIEVILSSQEVNQIPYYTDEMFEEALRAVERVQEEQRKKAEKEQLAKEAELRDVFEAEKQREIDSMKNILQEQVNKMKISEEERQMKEQEYYKQLETSSENRLKEMMKEFKKQQEEKNKDNEFRLQLAQIELEKVRLELTQKMNEKQLEYDTEMARLHRDKEQSERQMQMRYMEQADKRNNYKCIIS